MLARAFKSSIKNRPTRSLGPPLLFFSAYNQKRQMASIPPVAGDHAETAPTAAAASGSNNSEWRFPKANGSSRSYWLDTVAGDPLLRFRSTQKLPPSVEVAIIGSGMTGVLCAHSLLTSPQPPSSVIILEARDFCSGATGRNAGHCKPDQWRGFAKYRKLFGDQQAIKILRNERETWQRLGEFARSNQVECDLWTGKTMDVIMSEELAVEALKLIKEYEAAGGDVDHLTVVDDSREAEQISKVQGAKMIIAWDASTLSPWKLVAHMARKCLSLGLNLQTRTPVTSISPSSTPDLPWRLSTPRGDINAKTVVHATNAYASAILPEMQDFIRPGPHMCNAVVPPSSKHEDGPDRLEGSYSVMYPSGIHTINPQLGGDGAHIISAAPNNPSLVAYLAEDPMRSTDDGLADYAPIDDVVREFTEDALEWKRSENGEGADFLYSWSGIIGRSGDYVPFIGAIPDKPGQWICAGHNAHGMSRIFTAAPGLVKLIQGGNWSDTHLPECFEITHARLERLRNAAEEASKVGKKAYHPLR